MRARALHLAALAGLLVCLCVGVAYAIGLTVDPEALTTYRSTTQIPILQTCTPSASADTSADQLDPTTIFGSDPSMDVRSNVLGAERSFVKFDLDPCGFTGSTDVSSATLDLTLSSAPSESRTHEVARVTGSLDESLLTWLTQPSVSGSPTASAATGTTDGVGIQWDVTADVQAFVEGTATNNGWRIADGSEGAVLPITATYVTRENASAADRPSLEITYYP